MNIKSVKIKNFRSIKDLTLPIKRYGNDINESGTSFLVGINESGKSAILDAISLINDGISELDYENNCYIGVQDENKYIDIYADINLELEDISFLKNKIETETKLDKLFIEGIKIISLSKNVYRNSSSSGEMFLMTINNDLPFYQYILNTTIKTVGGRTKEERSLERLSEFNNITEDINEKNAKSFLLDNQKLLNRVELEEYLRKFLKDTLNKNMPKIQIWKSKPEYLINEEIDLNEFKENPDISKPLKNIFYIYGKKTDDEIKSSIENALKNQARCEELKEKMSEKVTKYINKIWKEHKIGISISINSSKCKVFVEDKDKKFAYYSMSQRSDGFKQFISLILSLSLQNEINELNDNIILIDEPEVHLHPSGVRYLRDEILKIGKNNIVIVSTHSHYMIDTETIERHWIVEKEKSETKISQISEGTSIADDKVISTAFGLNLFKELLPKNIIIVEGMDDKSIISNSISHLNNSFKFSIKPSGGASKSPAFARLLKDEKIPAFILFDADKEGRDNKKNILDNQSDTYSNLNVFTLKDITTTLPAESTIEDLMPIDFVKLFFDKELSHSFELNNDKAIVAQLKNQSEILKSNKQKLDSLKIKLSKEFCDEYNSKDKLEKEVPNMVSFVNNLITKIESFEQKE